jgi:hypothetical protein
MARGDSEMMSNGVLDRSNGGKLRAASALDESELARLVGVEIRPLMQHGHLLVLDLGNGRLGGAVHVELDGDHATIDLLVTDAEVASPALEHRLSGVAHAYCEAFGCEHVDTTSAVRPAVRSRGRR